MSDQYIPDDEPVDILSSLKELSQKTIPHAPTFKAAADVLIALRAENARLRDEHEASVTGYEIACDILADEREALRAENARLRGALKPFARIAEFYTCDADKDKDRVEIDLVVGDLRAARAAMGESDERV